MLKLDMTEGFGVSMETSENNKTINAMSHEGNIAMLGIANNDIVFP